MARHTFFSFHYKNDVWRAMQVRNSWVTKDEKVAEGFIDSADFEKLEKEGEDAVKRWINKQLEGTTVTVVLIGTETNSRPYVKYEIERSYARGNGMVGIYIHQKEDVNGKTCPKGSNHFGEIGKDKDGKAVYFSSAYTTYDWKDDDGYNNMGKWIEAAAKKQGSSCRLTLSAANKSICAIGARRTTFVIAPIATQLQFRLDGILSGF